MYMCIVYAHIHIYIYIYTYMYSIYVCPPWGCLHQDLDRHRVLRSPRGLRLRGR